VQVASTVTSSVHCALILTMVSRPQVVIQEPDLASLSVAALEVHQ